ncbi:type II toxin-antitoxin system Phd/YefM family antitoxin [Candidatus Gottesmanbacteria bacterium]|nr:type II toxin-antitoxin system Phd/YefM family antitoxin [Candidatus Gottesmanbacteria bacterium]
MQTLPTTLTASEARTNLYDMLDEVKRYLKRFVITHKGKPQAMVLPAEDVESMEETIEILSDSKLMGDIRQSMKDYKSGRYYTLDQVEQMLNKPSGKKKTS